MVHQQYPVLLAAGIVAAGLACSSGSSKAGGGRHSTVGGTAACKPLESREPNAANQQPAFPGQTRACEDKSNVAFDGSTNGGRAGESVTAALVNQPCASPSLRTMPASP